MTRRTAGHARPRGESRTAPGPDEGTTSGAPRLLALVVLATAAFVLTRGLWSVQSTSDGTATPPGAEIQAPPTSVASSVPSPAPTATASATATATPSGPLPIGVVAGHWGNDVGAVCDGGLQEVDINLAVAQRVVYTLRALGYPTDLLEEFDPRLEDYYAQALVSIHADSCLYPEASGFKVARVEDSTVPELEDRLVECLVARYQARTELDFHEGSITLDMTRYHTFYEIDPRTPGAIIEVGFMLADRDLLLDRQDLVADGIVEGILCFVREEAP